MKTVSLNLKEDSYNVLIGTGLIQDIGKRLKEMGFSGKAALITNPVVDALYGDRVRASLKDSGLAPVTLTVPDGEEHKTLDSAAKLYQGLGDARAERRTPVIALGGGVIGDLAGFVAATYLRGVPFIQLPTTLLSQVDSSTGGKVAVDMKGLKNRIGAFYQPKLVLSDVTTLNTLPERMFSSGMAEVIKSAVIGDAPLFDLIEQHIDRIKSQDESLLTEIVFHSIRLKAGYVEKDVRDTGIRNVLNLGHTIGHAIESVSDFSLSHGESVSIGMVLAGRIAARMELFHPAELERLTLLLMRAGLPVRMPELDKNKILEAMSQDKKVISGRMRFILPRKIGEVVICDDVSPALVKEVLS